MYFKLSRQLINQRKARLCEKGNAEEDGNCAIHGGSSNRPMTDSRNWQTNLLETNMSSSIKKNRRSVALTAAERKHREREKQRKNQDTDHDASNAEAQQPRPIPLTKAERKRRLRASKRQNQSNDAKAQNRSVPCQARSDRVANVRPNARIVQTMPRRKKKKIDFRSANVEKSNLKMLEMRD
jgi:hypothetical protein